MTHPTTGDDLLTTGQAADILGTTARHVVNLCLRGELPYTLAGTHRRVRRADVGALAARSPANRGGPLTDDQLRSLWLHRAAAGHVAAEPARSLEITRSAIQRSLARDPDGARWLRAWLDLIDRGPEAVMRTMTSTDPLARELRQNSPFLALLAPGERRAILAAFREARAAGTIGR
jgi:excisionase family DNA binding protein